MILGIDIYHGDVLYSDVHHSSEVECFNQVKAGGVNFVWHKATQGIGVTDNAYTSRRKSAEAAGLLWGAYHFNTGDSIPMQVQHFLDAAKPDVNTAMALDFEDNKASNMNLNQAVEFLTILNKELTRISGKERFAKIYSGNRMKHFITMADKDTRNFLAKHGLWLCQYGPRARLVDENAKHMPWDDYWLWQFTGDGIGPQPHNMPGIVTKGIDINRYEGTLERLKLEWAA